MNAARKNSRLRIELEACHRETARLAAPGFPMEAFETLQQFQRERLTNSYADLRAQERYAAAADFFLGELYGGRDLRVRDAQLTRALPILERTLPRRLRVALADAFRLQALSLALDIALAEGMHEREVTALDLESYRLIYPLAPLADRKEQIQLIYRLALELDRAVRLPLVPALIRAMRGPANLAGFSMLQAFLERGLDAFRAMGGAQEFAQTIHDREWRIMEAAYAGAANPFQLD